MVVHFTNNLAEETTIDWHGLRICRRRWTACPDHRSRPSNRAAASTTTSSSPTRRRSGTTRTSNAAVQEGNGLYGALLVDDPAEPAGLGDEVVMVLSDIAVNDDGSLQPADGGGDIGTLFGREGERLLVNGKVNPTLKARPGLRQRWRFINAAKTRLLPDRARRPHASRASAATAAC